MHIARYNNVVAASFSNPRNRIGLKQNVEIRYGERLAARAHSSMQQLHRGVFKPLRQAARGSTEQTRLQGNGAVTLFIHSFRCCRSCVVVNAK
jgi:hypothetical protein